MGQEEQHEEQHPQIDYPCSWEYCVIGQDRDFLCEEIRSVAGNRRFSLRDGHQKGVWHSVHLSLWVHDEAERNSIYVALKEITGVRMVI